MGSSMVNLFYAIDESHTIFLSEKELSNRFI